MTSISVHTRPNQPRDSALDIPAEPLAGASLSSARSARLARTADVTTGRRERLFRDLLVTNYRVSPDGTRILLVAIGDDGATSVWMADADGRSPPGRLTGLNADRAFFGRDNRGTTPPCVSWSPDGKFLFVYDRTAGHRYSIPIARDRTLPRIPHRGYSSPSQITAFAGVHEIREATAFPSRDPSTYPFFHVTAQRNIYRVRIPAERE